VKRLITQDMKSIGNLDIVQVDPGHITDLMLAIEAAGTPRKAPTVLSLINRIYAVCWHIV